MPEGSDRDRGDAAVLVRIRLGAAPALLLSAAEISAAIRALLAVAAVETNRPAVEAGLAMLDAGGDFADGVIAQEGAWLGGSTFLSFDQTAVTLLTAQGREAQRP